MWITDKKGAKAGTLQRDTDSIHAPLLLAVGLMLVLALVIMPTAQAGSEVGYIARLVGTVKIDDVKAKRGGTFNAGSSVTTGPGSYALLKFVDGQRVFLKADSHLNVDEYRYDENVAVNNASTLSLLKGGLRSISGLIAKHNREAVRYNTPTITMGVRGTEFMLSIVKGQLFIHVLSGAIGFIPPIAGMDSLEAGEYLALSDLGDVIGTGEQARQAAEKAGAFQQMNSTRMDSSAINTRFQWSAPRARTENMAERVTPSGGGFEQIRSDNTNTEVLEGAELTGKGRGDFTLIE